jgi:hypothetical protein
MAIQVTPVLCDFILRNFALTRLENLHDFLNSCDNFHFNTVSYRQSVVVLVEFT